MQFINIVVHSVENMNFRVYLQYEFTQLGLDSYLEVSKYCLMFYTFFSFWKNERHSYFYSAKKHYIYQKLN